ncbi:MAG: hypothetical protein AAFO07_21745 [Bacteroidota bacterium]
MKTYQPISCVFYDYIEHYAVLRKAVDIVYEEEGKQKTVNSKILDTQNTGTAEYVILKSLNEPLRMDRIISIDGIQLKDYQQC